MIIPNDFLLYSDVKEVRSYVREQIVKHEQEFVRTFIGLGKIKDWQFASIKLKHKDIINLLTDLIMQGLYDNQVNHIGAARIMVVFDRELDSVYVDFYACID